MFLPEQAPRGHSSRKMPTCFRCGLWGYIRCFHRVGRLPPSGVGGGSGGGSVHPRSYAEAMRGPPPARLVAPRHRWCLDAGALPVEFLNAQIKCLRRCFWVTQLDGEVDVVKGKRGLVDARGTWEVLRVP